MEEKWAPPEVVESKSSESKWTPPEVLEKAAVKKKDLTEVPTKKEPSESPYTVDVSHSPSKLQDNLESAKLKPAHDVVAPNFKTPEAALPATGKYIPEIEKKSYDYLKDKIRKEVDVNADAFKNQASINNYADKLSAQGYSKSTTERVKKLATLLPHVKSADEAFTKEPTAGNAIKSAELNMEIGDYKKAKEAYEHILNSKDEAPTMPTQDNPYPQKFPKDGAMYGIALANQRMGKEEDAFKQYNDIASKYPETPNGINALKALAGMQYQKGNKAESKRLMELATLNEQVAREKTGNLEGRAAEYRYEKAHENDVRDHLNSIANGIESMVTGMTPIGTFNQSLTKGADKIKEGLDNFTQGHGKAEDMSDFDLGKQGTGALQMLEGLSHIALGGVMSSTPGGALFDYAAKGASYVLPDQLMNMIMAPVSTAVSKFIDNPSEALKSFASLGDVVAGGLIMHGAGEKGVELAEKIKNNLPMSKEDVIAMQESIAKMREEDIAELAKKANEDNSHKVESPEVKSLLDQKAELEKALQDPNTPADVKAATKGVVNNINQELDNAIQNHVEDSHKQGLIDYIDKQIDALNKSLDTFSDNAKPAILKAIEELENRKKTIENEKTKQQVGKPATDKPTEQVTEQPQQKTEKVNLTPIGVEHKGQMYDVTYSAEEGLKVFKDGKEVTGLSAKDQVAIARKAAENAEKQAKSKQEEDIKITKKQDAIDRAKMGLDAVTKAEPRRWNDTVINEAVDKGGAQYGKNLVDSIIRGDNPRTDDAEIFALGMYKARLTTEYEKVMQDIRDTPFEDTEKLAQLQMKRDAIVNDFDTYTKVFRTEVSRKAGQSLNALKKGFQRDYSEISLITELKGLYKDKNDIPDEVKAKIEHIAKLIQDPKTKLAEITKKLQEIGVDTKADLDKANLDKGIRKIQHAVEGNKAKGKFRSREEILEERKQILADLKNINNKMRGQMNAIGPINHAPDFIVAVSKLVANLVKDGLSRTEDIINAVKTQFKDAGLDLKDEEVEDAVLESIANKEFHESKETTQASAEKTPEELFEAQVKKEEAKLNRSIDNAEKNLKALEEGTYEPKKKRELSGEVKERLQHLLDRKKELNDLVNKGRRELAKKKLAEERADNLLKDEKDKQKSGLEKFLRAAIKTRTSFLFTHPATMIKLGSAGLELALNKPISELGKYYFSKMPWTKDIAKHSPTFGNGSARALKTYYKQFATKENWKEAGRAILGRAEFDALHKDKVYDNAIYKDEAFSTKLGFVKAALAIPGNLHGAVKMIPKIAEYEASYQSAIESYLREHPEVREDEISDEGLAQIHDVAYDNALASILMNDNKTSAAINQFVDRSLKSDDNLEKVGGFLIQMLMPITKVPLNFAGQILDAVPLSNYVREGRSIRKAIKDKTVTPEQADRYMRSLNRQFVAGTISTFFAIGIKTGAISVISDEEAKKIKKETGEYVSPGTVVFKNGMRVSPLLMHNASIALANKVARSFDAMTGGKETLLGATASSAAETVKETPFYSVAENLDAAGRFDTRASVALGNEAGGMIVPGLVSDIAKWTDSEKQRKAKGFFEAIALKIPGLREMVKTPKEITKDVINARIELTNALHNIKNPKDRIAYENANAQLFKKAGLKTQEQNIEASKSKVNNAKRKAEAMKEVYEENKKNK